MATDRRTDGQHRCIKHHEDRRCRGARKIDLWTVCDRKFANANRLRICNLAFIEESRANVVFQCRYRDGRKSACATVGLGTSLRSPNFSFSFFFFLRRKCRKSGSILCHIMPSPRVFPCEQPRKFGLPKLDFLGYPMVKTI